ncbi:MAG: hypothetical protein NC181_05015 [Clostridium sp.]|nr:hypothetical protein [Clostridium sp.]MCM1444660.1 hypothetical protein [Candidatus Amulumruptor caecigallinarius]
MDNYNDIRDLLDSENIKRQIRELRYDEDDLNETMQNSIGNHGKIGFFRKNKNVIDISNIVDIAKMTLISTAIAVSVITILNSVKNVGQSKVASEKSSISNVVSTEYETLSEQQLQSVVDDAYMLLREGLNSNYYDIIVYDLYASKGIDYLDKVFNVLNIMKSSDEKYKYIRSYPSSFEYFKSLNFIDENGNFLSKKYEECMISLKHKFFEDRFNDELAGETKTI